MRSGESYVLRQVQRKVYKTIPLQVVEDSPELSWKAVGIHTYLITRPQGWKIYRADVVGRHRDGVDGVKSGLMELRRAGYLRTKPTPRGGHTWFVSEVALPDETWVGILKPEGVKPEGGNSADGKGSRITDYSTSKQEVLRGMSVGEKRPSKKKRRKSYRDYTPEYQRLWSILPLGSKYKGFDECEIVINELGIDLLCEKRQAYRDSLSPDNNGQALFRWLADGRWEEEFATKATERGYDFMADIDRLSPPTEEETK